MGWSVSSPLNPGKSMRSSPTSPLSPVPLTHEGVPWRASAQARISSWSVVIFEEPEDWERDDCDLDFVAIADLQKNYIELLDTSTLLLPIVSCCREQFR